MSLLKEIQGFTPPILHTGKDWNIDFYAFNPVYGEMPQKEIKLNHIGKITDRRKCTKDYNNK